MRLDEERLALARRLQWEAYNEAAISRVIRQRVANERMSVRHLEELKSSARHQEQAAVLYAAARAVLETAYPGGRRYHYVSWITCTCGKEFQFVARESHWDTLQARLRLATKYTCRTCEEEYYIKADRCPCVISLPNGASGCTQGWNHVGPCTPREPKDRKAIVKKVKESMGWAN